MQIILLRSRSQAKSITLTGKQLLLAVLVLLMVKLALVTALHQALVRYATQFDLPYVQNVIGIQSARGIDDQDKYLRENLTAMAIRLGEMQAQLMRLDALGERVQGLAGIKPEEFSFRELPGRGGPLPAGNLEVKENALSMDQFQKALDALATDIERRSDYMNVVESSLMADRIKTRLLPTVHPVNVAYNASSFGWRLDPFTGRSGFHEGIDFAAPVGTPIVAAAGGVVVAAEYHPHYGNMLDIDHGNDIVTRYAHASKLLVKVGDIVRRGQHIANIGSTGRSTGAHLHFEVHMKGVPQNPNKFLYAGGAAMQKIAAQ